MKKKTTPVIKDAFEMFCGSRGGRKTPRCGNCDRPVSSPYYIRPNYCAYCGCKLDWENIKWAMPAGQTISAMFIDELKEEEIK